MGLQRTFAGIWKTREETSENAAEPELRTRYYKQTRDKLVNTVLETLVAQLPAWKVVHTDLERGEIMVEKKTFLGIHDIVISIYAIGPLQSAIEIVSAKRGNLGDFGASYRNIVEFYSVFDKNVAPETR